MTKRVVVYVDGLNLYNGLKAADWRKYYWLDLVSFFSKFLKPHQILQGVEYFSCRPIESEKEVRQNLFFQANTIDPRFKIYLGALHRTKVICRNCHSYDIRFVEKESDVRMASHMISNAVQNKCDVSFLVSGDRDFLPAIEAVHELKSNHKVFVLFPPGRTSFYLKGVSDSYIDLARHEQKFTTSLLPSKLFNPITLTPILRPPKWS